MGQGKASCVLKKVKTFGSYSLCAVAHRCFLDWQERANRTIHSNMRPISMYSPAGFTTSTAAFLSNVLAVSPTIGSPGPKNTPCVEVLHAASMKCNVSVACNTFPPQLHNVVGSHPVISAYKYAVNRECATSRCVWHRLCAEGQGGAETYRR